MKQSRSSIHCRVIHHWLQCYKEHHASVLCIVTSTVKNCSWTWRFSSTHGQEALHGQHAQNDNANKVLFIGNVGNIGNNIIILYNNIGNAYHVHHFSFLTCQHLQFSTKHNVQRKFLGMTVVPLFNKYLLLTVSTES